MSVVGAMAVAGSVITAQADPADGWSVTAGVAETPAAGIADSTSAAGLVAVAGLSAGAEVAAGSELTYVLTVSRAADAVGDDLASVSVVDDVTGLLDNAKVTGTLPDGVLFDGANITWNTPDMGRGNTATTYFQVTVNDNATVGATLATGAGLGDLACTADSCATSLTVAGATPDAPATDSTTAPETANTTAPETSATDGTAEAPPADGSTGPENSTDGAPTETPAVIFSAANEDGQLLAGAAFSITASDGTVYCVIDNDAAAQVPGCGDGKVVSDRDPADGAFRIEGLPADSYSLAAIVPPPSYVLPTETKNFELDAPAATTDESAATTDESAATTDESAATTDAGQPFRGAQSIAFAHNPSGSSGGDVVDAGVMTFKSSPVTVQCSAGYVYGISENGQIRQVAPGGAVSDFGTAASGVSSFNGLGIGLNGSVVYGYERTNDTRTVEIYQFSLATAAWTSTGKSVNSDDSDRSVNFVAGAVDPSSGTYYFGGYKSDGTKFRIWKFSGNSISYIGYIDTTSGAGGRTNGDMAFDGSGNVFVVRGSGSTTTVFSATAQALSNASGGQIAASMSNSVSTQDNVNGVAFDASGKAFLGTGGTLTSYTMPSWNNANTVVSQNLDSTDLSSCSNPVTVVLQKNVIGRVNSTDQFKLTVSSGSADSSATTSGSKTGLQDAAASLLVAPNSSVTVSEAGASGANLSNYTSTLTCDSGIKPSNGTFTVPSSGTVTCTFTNTPPSLTLVKKVTTPNGSADVTSSSNVSQWTLTATKGGSVAFAGAANSAAVTAQPVGIGTAYTLSESSVNGYDNGDTWQCKLPDGTSVTVTNKNKVTPAAGQQITCTITNKQKASSLSIKKLDAATNQPVGGAKFQLYVEKNPGTRNPAVDTKVGSEVTTPASSPYTATASGLAFGTYYWVETAAPAGYELPTGSAAYSDPQVIDAGYAQGGSAAVLTVKDAQVTTALTVKKVDDKTGAALAGAEFELYTGTPPAAGNPTGTRAGACTTTTPNGTCTVPDLAFGTYYWYEKSAPSGYDLPANRFSAAIVLSSANAGKTIAATEFRDPQKPTSLVVKKLDDKSGVALTGATFELYTGNPPAAGSNPTGTKIDDCTTAGADGSCSVVAPGFGTYYWYEKSAPAGYELPANRFSSVITITSSNAGTTPTATIFRDPQKLTTLKLVKKDQDGNALAGATFQLWRDTNGTSGLQTTGGSADTNVGTCTTTGDGTGTCQFANQPFGDYYWVETKAPAGYTTPAQSVTGPVTVNAANAGTTKVTTVTNSKLQPVTVKKDPGTATQNATTGLWTVTYTVTVHNPNNQASVYSLNDTPQFAAGVTVTGASATYNGGSAGSWDSGSGMLKDMANGRDIAAGADHVYHVSVTATVPAAVAADVRDCAAAGAGYGFYNEAAVTSFGHTETDDACIDIPTPVTPVLAKSVVGHPVQDAATGNWTITYQVTAKNASTIAATDYSLTDTLKYGAGITIVSAAVAGPAGVSLTAGWTGQGAHTQIAANVVLPANTTHTYTVTVTAKVNGSAKATDRDCSLDGGENGTGFLNSATLTSGTSTDTKTACDTPVSPTITKSFNGTAATQHLVNGTWDGTWDAAYTVTVKNPSPTTDLRYSLSDTPDLPAGVAIVTASAKRGATAVGSWVDPTITGMATNRTLAHGDTDTYTVTLNVRIDSTVADPADLTCAATPTPKEGLYNKATAVSGSDTLTADACGSIPQAPTPGITKVVKSVQQSTDAAGTWTVIYDVQVKNDSKSGMSGVYRLSDTLAFGGNITVVSAAVASLNGVVTSADWNGTSKSVIVANGVIPDDTTYTFRVTVTATLGANATSQQLDCAMDQGETGTGFLNKARVSSGTTNLDAEACATPARPTITKTAGAPTQHLGAGGTWDGVSWDVPYTITVSNPSTNGTNVAYTLSDTPAYPAGVNATGGSVTSATSTDATTPTVAGAGSKGTFAAGTLTIIDTPRALAAGKADTFGITILASVPANQDAATLACQGATDKHGFANVGTVKSGAYTADARACTDIPQVGKPTIAKTVTSVTQNTNGSWTTVYSVVVDNSANGFAATYSLSDAPTFGGDIDITAATASGPAGAIAGWDGTAGKTTLANGATVAAGAKATYTVTITADVKAAAYQGQDPTAFCAADHKKSAGHGFFNEATLTVPGAQDQIDADCASPVTPTLAKTFVSAVQHTVGGVWDGTWDVTYTVTVTNPSQTTGLVYSLSDKPSFPTGVTVGSVSSSPSGTWNAATGTVTDMAKNKALAKKSHDDYTIVVNATVGAGVADANLVCATPTPKAGQGFYNDATVTSGTYTETKNACGDIQRNPKPTVVKTLDGAPAQQADGTWNIAYKLTVTNPSATQQGRFDLSDSLKFGAGLTVNTAAVSGPDAAADWNGSSKTVIVTNHTIAKGATLEYRVTVNASVAADTPDATRLCDATPSAGHGFFNAATITVDGVPTDSSVCASPAKPTITKTFKSVVQSSATPWDGTWLVTYDVAVTNPDTHGTALRYSLSDTPTFPAGVTINGATASPQGTWNGTSIAGMATNKSLAAGATDTYTVTVTATFGSTIAAGDMACATPDTPGKGLYNKATATSGNDDVSAVDCGNIPGPAKPALTKTVIGTPVQGADGNWTIQYRLTVSNAANDIAAKYSLNDDLGGFASGIQVQSRTVTNPAGTTSAWNGTDALATDRSIAARATESYTVTVVAKVTDKTAPADRICDAGTTPGHGFFNSAKLTAGGSDETKTACASPATPEITKTFGSAVQHPGSPWNGTWDVTYTVTVHNPTAATGLVYSLSDTPDYATGVTINTATASLGGAPVGDAWNGTTIANMATDKPLAGGATDTYTVAVNVTVADTVAGDALTCAQTPAPDRGLYNKAVATSGDDTYTATACGDIPNPPQATVAKTVTSATQNAADGSWTVVYDLSVINTQPTLFAPYTLSDTLAFGGHITVTSAAVGLPGGGTHATWTGVAPNTAIVPAGVVAPATTLHYTVTVTATVGADATSTDMNCTIDGNEAGTGFLNTATLKSGSHPAQTVKACAEPVRPVIEKTAGTPTQNITGGVWDGTWNVPYTITVKNPSTDGRTLKYLLSDTTRFPAGVTATAGKVTGSDDGSGTAVAGITGGGSGIFSGTSLSIITATSGPRDLAAGKTDTFQIAITAVVPVDQDPATLKCQTGVANNGFDNLGTVTSGGTSITDDGCSDIPAPAKPTIAKALDGQPVQDAATGLWTVRYTLTVDNTAGAVAANYTLTDKMDYGTGIDIKSASAAPDPSGNWNGTSQQTIAKDATVAAGAKATFAVTVTAEVTGKATSTSAACVDQTTPGHGFFNGATLAVGTTSSNSTVCAEPALPTVAKAFVSTADNAAGGWDVTYTLTVTNPSADKALYYSLTDTPAFAAGIDVTGAKVTAADVAAGIPGSWNAAAGTLTIIPAGSEVSLAAGAHQTFTVVVSTAKPAAAIDGTVLACTTPSPTAGHGFYNRTDVTSGGATFSADACAGIPAWTVAKTVDKQTAQPGDTLTYTLTAKNTGPVDVSGAKGIDTLPANVTIDATKLDPALSLSADGKTLTWAIPAMPAGSAAVTVGYQVTVAKSAEGTTQTNLVVPEGPGGSCEPSQGQNSNCTTDTDVPRWTLVKTSDPASGSTVQPGSTIKYTLTVTNKGPKALSGAAVVDDLAGVLNNAAFVAGSIAPSGTGSATLTGTSLTWTLPDGIAVNATATVSYSVTVNAGAQGITLTNVATPAPNNPAGVCEPSTDPNAPANANCTTTHRTPPPVVIPATATPAYSIDQCLLGDNGNPDTITVSTVTRSGIAYTVTGNGTNAVTVVATAQAGYQLNVPSGWTGNTSSASITVRPSDAAICVGGESSTTTAPSTTPAVNVGPSETIEVLPSHGDIAYTGVDTVGMSALALLLLVLGGGLLWLGMAGWRRPTQH